MDFNGGCKGKKIVIDILDWVDELEDYFEFGLEEYNFKFLGQGYCLLLIGIMYKVIYLVVKFFIVIIDIFDVW